MSDISFKCKIIDLNIIIILYINYSNILNLIIGDINCWYKYYYYFNI